MVTQQQGAAAVCVSATTQAGSCRHAQGAPLAVCALEVAEQGTVLTRWSWHAVPCCAVPLVVQVLPKVKQQLQATQRDVATVAADLQRGVHRNIREMSQQLEVRGV